MMWIAGVLVYLAVSVPTAVVLGRLLAEKER